MRMASTANRLAVAGPALALLAAGCGAERGDGGAADEKRVPVVLTPAVSREFRDSLTVHGDVRAKHFANVSARIPGTIERIFVDEGDDVSPGARLFQTDSLKCEKALEIARKSSDMARLSLREAKAGLDVAEADFEAAERVHGRFKRLLDEGGVMREAFDQKETMQRKARAGLEHARTVVELAAEKERQAALAVKVAEKDLRDTLVLSPIAGTVSERRREPGEMGSPGKTVIRVDDTSVVEVTASLPARLYAAVVPGETKMRVVVGDVDGGERTITFKSPTIDQRLRTFKVRCVIAEPPDGFVPGAMARATVTFARRTALAVPTDSVLRREGKRILFAVAGERARRMVVMPGLESGGWTELCGTALRVGTPVVSMGQFLLDDGAAVKIRKGTE